MGHLDHSHTVLLAAVLAVAAPPGVSLASDAVSRSPTCRNGCQKRYTIPAVRIAVLELGMHTAAGALWPEGYHPLAVQRNRAQLRQSWTHAPEFHFTGSVFSSDNDWWYFNVFAHGLFGSEAYLAARVWGHRPVVACLHALVASFAWEYLVEAWYKPPSAIDLFWTPLSGVIFGELRFWAYRRVSRRIARPGLRRFWQVLLDPLGAFERKLVGCSLEK